MHRFVGSSDLAHFLILQSIVFGFASVFSGLEQYLSKGLDSSQLTTRILLIVIPLFSIIIGIVYFIERRVFGADSNFIYLITAIDLIFVILYSLCRGITLGLHSNVFASGLTFSETTIRLLTTLVGLKFHLFTLVLLAPAVSNLPVAIAALLYVRSKKLQGEFGTTIFRMKSAISLMVQAPLSSLFTQSLVLFMVTIQPGLTGDSAFLRFSSLLPVFRWPISLVGLFSALIIPWFSRYGSPDLSRLSKNKYVISICSLVSISAISLLEVKTFGTFKGFGIANYVLVNFAFFEIALSLILTSQNIARHLEVKNTRIWIFASILIGVFFYSGSISNIVEFMPTAFVLVGGVLLTQLARSSRKVVL
jgi:hypothetical protein